MSHGHDATQILVLEACRILVLKLAYDIRRCCMALLRRSSRQSRYGFVSRLRRSVIADRENFGIFRDLEELVHTNGTTFAMIQLEFADYIACADTCSPKDRCS